MIAQGPFSLAASTRFLEGFTPAAIAASADQRLDLAFCVEGTWQTVGVRVRSCKRGGVLGELVSPVEVGEGQLDAVRSQVERILSLDVDGTGFPDVGGRDPVVGRMQQAYPGLRPVGFWSAYEAAAWAIIGHRIRIRQAAAIKARMAEELGEEVDFGDHVVHTFPGPARLAELDGFAGLSGRKPEWLRALGGAALDGRLDSAHLRSLAVDQALAELKRLPGIGDFSAELVLLRGAGAPDHVPRHETRLSRAVGLAYDLAGPATAAQLTEISDGWRPYRTWVTLLLRTWLEDTTGEITGRGPRVSPRPA